MTKKEAHIFLIKSLDNIYPKGEVKAIAKVYLEWLFTSANKDISASLADSLSTEQINTLKADTQKLIAGNPLQYVTEEAWFYKDNFYVNNSVLIPRPETEELVDIIIKENKGRKAKILDIGTGSGCIAISLQKHLPTTIVVGIDIDEGALEVARKNAENLKAKTIFKQRNILTWPEWVADETYNIIVSNPPYIPATEKAKMDKVVTDHEPHLALFVTDADPLIFYRTIAEFAKMHLSTEGKIYLETHYDNATTVKEIFEEKGFAATIRKDMSGNDRFVIATPYQKQ